MYMKNKQTNKLTNYDHTYVRKETLSRQKSLWNVGY